MAKNKPIIKKMKLIGIIAFYCIIATIFSGCLFYAGTYTRRGNNATLYIDGYEKGTATVSGNTLSGIYDGDRFTVTKVNTGSNPFAGTWKGTDEDGDSVELVFGDSFLLAYYTEYIDEIDEDCVGEYEYDGNEAEWEIDDHYDDAVISGNRLRGTVYGYEFTAAKTNTSSNPFAGTWSGRIGGYPVEILIGETTWAIRVF